jgi:Ca2+-binding RTX toxin-like protein
VNDSAGSNNTITVGKGNDTIYVGQGDTIKVGTGQDSFVFQQTTPGSINAVTVTGFDPSKDSFIFSNQLTTSVSYHDDSHGNAVVTVDNAGDTITLMGVHSSQLQPSDFHFVDPAAVPTPPSTAQMVADLHAHALL